MKRERLLHFEKRLMDDEPIQAATGERIITVHPLSDQNDLLNRLGMTPEECIACDAYCEVSGDVVFVQLICAKADSFRAPGIYVSVADNEQAHLTFLAVLSVESLSTRDLLEAHRAICGVQVRRHSLSPKLTRLENL